MATVGGDERREERRAFVIVCTLILGMVVALAAVLAHKACFEPGPPVDPPMSGTPRAGYCSALQATDPWLSLTLTPLLVFALAAILLRRQRLLWLGAVALVCAVAVLANAAIANSLEFAITF